VWDTRDYDYMFSLNIGNIMDNIQDERDMLYDRSIEPNLSAPELEEYLNFTDMTKEDLMGHLCIDSTEDQELLKDFYCKHNKERQSVDIFIYGHLMKRIPWDKIAGEVRYIKNSDALKATLLCDSMFSLEELGLKKADVESFENTDE